MLEGLVNLNFHRSPATQQDLVMLLAVGVAIGPCQPSRWVVRSCRRSVVDPEGGYDVLPVLASARSIRRRR